MPNRYAFIVALLGAATFHGVSARAETISQEMVFGNTGQSIWQSGTGGNVSYDGLLGPSWDTGTSIGKVKCFFGCYGAELGLKVSGYAGLGYSLQLGSGSMAITFPEKIVLTTPDANTVAAGSAFTIKADVTPATTITLSNGSTASANLQTTGPTLAASLDLRAQLNLEASARVCVVGCLRASGSINPGFKQSLLALDSTAGTLSVLGNSLTNNNGAFSASLLGGAAGIEAKFPVLNSDSAQGGGWSGTALGSSVRSNVLGLNVSLDRIVTTLAGLPPLNGSIGPLSYNILTANAGATLDVKQDFSFTPNLQALLNFTAPVAMQQADGTFAAATNTATLALAAGSNSFTFQAPDVTALGVRPTYTLNNTTSNQTSLVVGGSVAVSAGSIGVFGKSLGPIFSTTQSLGDLPAISVYSNNFNVNLPSISANPFNIAFGPAPAKTQLAAEGFNATGISRALREVVSDSLFTPNGALDEDYLLVGAGNGASSLYEVRDLQGLIASGTLIVGNSLSPADSCAVAEGLGPDGNELVCSRDGSAIKPYLAGLSQVAYVGDTDATTTDSSGNSVFYDASGLLATPLDTSVIAHDSTDMDDAELQRLGVTGTVLAAMAAATDAPEGDIPVGPEEELSTPDDPVAVPEPGALGLLLVALTGFFALRRRAGSA